MSRTPGPWHVGVKQAGIIVYDQQGWAAFIVQACNAHDELVAALRGLLHNYGSNAAQDAARAALAKVGV